MDADVREKLRGELTKGMPFVPPNSSTPGTYAICGEFADAVLAMLDAMLDNPKLKQPRYYPSGPLKGALDQVWYVLERIPPKVRVDGENVNTEAKFYGPHAERYAREHAERLNREER